MSNKILSLLVIALMIAVSAPVASAEEGAIHYVHEGESIQDAIDAADTGDSIILYPGVYDEGTLFIEKSVTLRGSGADTVTLIGRIQIGERDGLDGRKAIDITCTISNMTIDNTYNSELDGSDFLPAIYGFMVNRATDGDSEIKNPSRVSVIDCAIRSIVGIQLIDIDHVEILRNTLYGGNGFHAISPFDGGETPEGTGISVGHCYDVTIASNFVSAYVEDGIYIAECYDICTKNNIVYGCGDWGINTDAMMQIHANNTLYDNGWGIKVVSSEACVVNNIVVLSSLYGALDGYTLNDINLDADYDLVFMNNDIYRSMPIPIAPLDGTNPWGFPPEYDIRLTSAFGPVTVDGNIFEDPLLKAPIIMPSAPCEGLDGAIFIDSSGMEEMFKLHQTSPCKDAGVYAAADTYGNVINDYFGTSRPQGGFYDIGAYEVPASYSPASMQPMVMTALANASQSWNAILGSLPDTLTGEQQALLDAIQAFMEQAKALGNPIAANGALQQALAQMNALMATL